MTAQARIGRLVAVNAAAFVAAVLLLFILFRLRGIVSVSGLIVLAAVMAAALAGEVGMWIWRGVRSIGADDAGITLLRGAGLREQRITRGELAQVRVTRRLGRRRIVFSLNPRELRIAGVTLPLPRRLVIAEDAFAPEDFTALLDVLDRWPGGLTVP